MQKSSFAVFALWQFLAITANWFVVEPIFFYSMTLVFLSYIFVRYWFVRGIAGLDEIPDDKITQVENKLRVICLVSPIFWGGTISYVFFNPDLSGSRAIALAVTCFVCGAAYGSYAIDRVIGKLSASLSFVPLFFTLIFIHFYIDALDKSEVVLCILLVVGSYYLMRQNRLVADDFERAQLYRRDAERRASKMQDISSMDALTQINNRMYFDNQIKKAWAKAKKYHSRLTVFVLDLDHFKLINDTYGHLFGDECLQEVAATLKKQVRGELDCLARYGGEEFVVLLEDTEDVDVNFIASRLLKGVREMYIEYEGEQIKITCSIGVASVYPASLGSFSQVILMADKALYRAKRNGRDTISVADANGSSSVLSMLEKTLAHEAND